LKEFNNVAEASMKPYVAAAIADLERRAGIGNHVAPVGQ
jgi:hypothetical protein